MFRESFAMRMLDRRIPNLAWRTNRWVLLMIPSFFILEVALVRIPDRGLFD